MSMTTARDARKFRAARAALRSLLDAGDAGATGQSIFGDDWASNRWSGMLLRSLMAVGVVRVYGSEPSSPGRPGRRRVRYVAEPSLSSVVASDSALAEHLWGSMEHQLLRAGPPSEVDPEDVGAEEWRAHGDSTPLTSTPGEPADAAPDETLQAVLKLSAATLENLVYMREQLSALASDVATLKKAWES